MSVQLIQGDCVDALRSLNTPVDAIIMDPPYCSGSVSEASRTTAKGQGLRSETIQRLGWFVGDNMGTAGLMFLLRTVAAESTRLLKPTGSLLCFCDWRMVPNIAPAIESVGLRFQNLVVWDKGHMGLGAGFRTQHEIILHYTAGRPEYHDKGTPNVLGAKRVGYREREHQTQKPTALIEALVKVVAPPDGAVLDPFMGSGTTGVASVRTGRSFIGIEKDPNYFAIAKRRITAIEENNNAT